MFLYTTSTLNSKDKKWFRIFEVGCAFILTLSVANCIIHLYKYGMLFGDYRWIWIECLYTIKRIDIVEAIRDGIVIKEMGDLSLPPNSATLPWSRILGIVIHPGFLPKEWAFVYGTILYAALAVVTIYCVARKMCQYNVMDSRTTIIMTITIMLMSFYWTDAVLIMNNACVVVLLLILVAIECDRNEYVSGILMAFAMIKPQIALLFYITLLFKRKYKTIITSALIVCGAWIFYLFWVGGNPVTQIMDVIGLSQGERPADHIWYGLMDILVRRGYSGTVSMICSMLLGIVLTIVLTIVVLNSRYAENPFVLYSIPAFFSTVWCYKSETDLLILSFVSLLVFFILELKGFNFRTVTFCLFFLGMFNVKVFTSFFRQIVGYDWLVGRSLDAWIRTFIFIFVVIMIAGRNIFSPNLNKKD